MNSIKPWYASRTIWGALVAIAASLGNLLGFSIEAGDQAVLVDGILQLVAAIGGVIAIFGRMTAAQKIN